MNAKTTRQAASILTAIFSLALVSAPSLAEAAEAFGAPGSTVRVSNSQLNATLSQGNLRFTGYVMFVDDGMKKATVDVRFTVSGITVGSRGVSLRIHTVRKAGADYLATGQLSFAGVSQTVNLPMRLAASSVAGNRYSFNETIRGSR